ncbi:class I SAM-dependent DNA methyltransferase [Mastigocladopsis repens]|uniref:class I SAM-dependent DNA methyltransferase n=1 Tax=Mastigocladopsis repens TaxID=221287 RepID=UPI0002D6A066|nr:class I SAM-dependent methyltransferase [Mastigocladopsis repens]
MFGKKSLFFNGSLYDSYHNAGKSYFYQKLEDIPLWLNLARKYGEPILELACGTGRISIPLAEQGFQVTGIDISQSMLDVAKQKSSQVEWLEADIRDFKLEKKFALIILPYFLLMGLLKLKDIETCLDCVRRHLQPGGTLIIDVMNPSRKFLLDLLLLSQKRFLDCIFPNPEGKDNIVVTIERGYVVEQQILIEKLFYNIPGETEEVVDELKLRLYFPEELEMLLKYNGFTIERKFGDYDMTPFTSESPQQIVVCKASL